MKPVSVSHKFITLAETGLNINGIDIKVDEEFETVKSLYPNLSDELINEAITSAYVSKSVVPLRLSTGQVINLVSRRFTVTEYISLGKKQHQYDFENRDTKKGEEDYRPYCLKCSTMLRMDKTNYGFVCKSCRNKINVCMYGLDEDTENYSKVLVVDFSDRAEDPIVRAKRIKEILEPFSGNYQLTFMEEDNQLGYLVKNKGLNKRKIAVILPCSRKTNSDTAALLDSLYGDGLAVKDKIVFYPLSTVKNKPEILFSTRE